MLETGRNQFGLSTTARQHIKTRYDADCGMPEFCIFSDFAANKYRAELLGCEPKQGFLANLTNSDCFENKV